MTVISIIVPLYNGRRYIEQLTESLLRISVEKEILIVDDGSTDNGGQYCKDRYKDNKEVFVLSKQNGGVKDARNYGLQHSSGLYVMFVDQDDFIDPEVISSAVCDAYVKKYSIALWKTAHLYEDHSIETCDDIYRNLTLDRTAVLKDLIPSMLLLKKSEYVSYLGHVWAGIYERKMIVDNDIHFTSFRDYEDDFLFVFDCLVASDKVRLISKTGYFWYENRESTSRTTTYIENYISKSEEFHLYIYKKILQIESEELKADKYIEKARQRIIVRAVKNAASSFPDSKNALKSIVKITKNSPYFEALAGKHSIMATKTDKIMLRLICRRHVRIAYAFYFLYIRLLRRFIHRKKQCSSTVQKTAQGHSCSAL